MSDSSEPWGSDEATPRWLIVDGVPALNGESALALIELLYALSESIEIEYADTIEGYRRSRQVQRNNWTLTTPWFLQEEDRQLRLDLGDDDYF